jgi:hypothetical protein
MLARRLRDLLLDRWWIVALSLLCFGLAAVGLSLFTPPIYQATSLVKVDIPSTDTTIVAGISRVTYTETQLAMSSQALRSVASHYRGVTLEQLRSEVSATQLPNTSLIQIIVRDASPSFAAILADDVARTLISQQTGANNRNNALAQQPTLDAIAATNTLIQSAASDLDRLEAVKGDPAQIAAAQARLDILTAQLAQQQASLSAIQSDQAKRSFYLYLTQTAQLTLPIAKARGFSGDACGAPLRSRLKAVSPPNKGCPIGGREQLQNLAR